MKTIYKANGRTFNNLASVQKYAVEHGMVITNQSSFVHKNTKVFCIDLAMMDISTSPNG